MRIFLTLILVLSFSFSFSQDVPKELIIEDFSEAIVNDNKVYTIESLYGSDPYILYNLREGDHLVEIGHFFQGLPHGKWYKVENNQIVSIVLYQNGRVLEYINIEEDVARRYVKKENSIEYQKIDSKNIVYSNSFSPTPKSKIELDDFLFSDL